MHESFILECFGQLAELHLHCFYVKHPIAGVTPRYSRSKKNKVPIYNGFQEKGETPFATVSYV